MRDDEMPEGDEEREDLGAESGEEAKDASSRESLGAW